MADVFVRIGTDFKEFKGGLKEFDGALEAMGKSAGGLGGVLGKVVGGPLSALSDGLGKIGLASMGIGAVAGALGGLAGAVTGSIGAASDVAESQSKVNTVFGDGARAITDFASTSAAKLGLSKGAALDAAGSFGNLFSQLKIAPALSADMSKGMLTLAADFASFHNADISQVIEAQTAAFRGEYDSLQRFVPTINAAAVEQQALAMTHKASTKELTEQDKALAVHALMMQGAGAAQGDFARTSDGLANAQRIISASFEDLKVVIGEQLLPLVAPLAAAFARTLPGAIEAAKPIVQGIGSAIAGVANTIMPLVEGTVAAVQKLLGGDAGGAIGAVAAAWAGFWRTLQPILADLSGKVVGWIGEQAPTILAQLGAWGTAFVDWVAPQVVPLLREADRLASSLWTWITDTAAPVLLKKLGAWAKQFTDWIGPAVDPMLTEAGKLATRLGTWITDDAAPVVLAKLGAWAKAFSDWIGPAVDAFLAEWPANLERFLSWIENTAAPAIATQLGAWVKAFTDWIGGEGDQNKAAGGMLAALGRIAGALVTFVGKTAEVLAPHLLKWAGAFLGWVATSVVPFLAEQLAKVTVAIGTWLVTDAIPWAGRAFLELGKAIVLAIVAGIKAAPGAIGDALKSLLPVNISVPSVAAPAPSYANVPSQWRPPVNVGGGVQAFVGGVPQAAAGGLITSSGLAMVHAAEVVGPLEGIRGMLGGGAGGIDYDRLAQAMARVQLSVSVDDVHGGLLRKQARNAGLGLVAG